MRRCIVTLLVDNHADDELTEDQMLKHLCNGILDDLKSNMYTKIDVIRITADVVDTFP